MKVRIVLRETLEEVANFGKGGRYPGMFFGVHSIATDSDGNIYTTETYEGKRLQKFVYKGMGPATKDQGARGQRRSSPSRVEGQKVWPVRSLTRRTGLFFLGCRRLGQPPGLIRKPSSVRSLKSW